MPENPNPPSIPKSTFRNVSPTPGLKIPPSILHGVKTPCYIHFAPPELNTPKQRLKTDTFEVSVPRQSRTAIRPKFGARVR